MNLNGQKKISYKFDHVYRLDQSTSGWEFFSENQIKEQGRHILIWISICYL